ncbi:MAG: 3-phenylpropionate/trans-cinnamate dioxygenase ferredoxin reductase component [Microbacteriaceae bacterium]|jgi:3-phenylpropionate/trans-cinnamate dioxygenase ferredoxin reductase subunit|nr:3-phenylpropionate/trans-cinnamate dioxygenase ferredoxin reductase component [Microbacteriaceae bacterium]
MTTQTFVIVGAGLAGATAARTLRHNGFEGRIVLVGAETHHPYIRPPLSKDFLKRETDRGSVFVHKDDGWYTDNAIELVLGTEAETLDAAFKELHLLDGTTLPYDKLLLATGSSPRRLDLPGGVPGGVHYLRTLEDSERLSTALAEGGRTVVVVGAGWIGLEVAAAARGFGNDVTVLGRGQIPLSSAIGDELGRVFEGLHRDNGVQFRMPGSVASISGADGHVTELTTDAGERLPADLVVVGVGAVPNVRLAEQARLAIADGITVTHAMRTSDPSVFAAGDVANTFHPTIGRHLRSEHWANALAGGKVAGLSMLGFSVSHTDIPYFYTDQYDLSMEFSGYTPLMRHSDVVYRGDRDARSFIAFWLREGRVVAGMNVNVPGANDEVQALIRSSRVVERALLEDEGIPLAEL